jgi:hypothetical protein
MINMKTGTIQSLACLGLGAVLGLGTATRDTGSPAQAHESPTGPRQVGKQLEITDTESNPLSCSTGIAMNSLLARVEPNRSATESQANSSAKKPNILVIWGDDIGIHNISAYNHGIMGYKTPNIDRLAKEGAMFTDFYAQQSCTAGRASFILGQHPFRTGLLTIGMPGSPTASPTGHPQSPTSSNLRATPLASSARTTSATTTSTCRQCTDATSSSVTCTT